MGSHPSGSSTAVQAPHPSPADSLLLCHAGPFTSIYFSSQFGPLIIFFVLFLAVVRNQRLHHFVRFNTMQVGLLAAMSDVDLEVHQQPRQSTLPVCNLQHVRTQ